MKKNKGIFIIVFSTFVSVITMVSWSNYVSNSKSYEEDKLAKQGEVLYSKEYISTDAVTSNNPVKVVKKDDMSKKENANNYKSEGEKKCENSNVDSSNANMKKIDKSKELYDEMYLIKREDSLESYYLDNIEKEQSVFKVSTGEIKEKLTTSDKVKLLYVSMQLGKDEYEKVQEYLYSDNAEDGVLKALKLLKQDLSKKEYEKVRKIAGRFIDMDAAERLY